MFVRNKVNVMVMILMLALSALASSHLLAKSGDHEVKVIQERLYDQTHEIFFEGGYIPGDFYDSFPVGGGYLYHFNETWAWEVFRAEAVADQEKDIVTQLAEEFRVEPSQFDRLTQMVQTALVFKPTYGKDAFLNSRIINHESSLSLGLGVATFDADFPEDETLSENAPMLSLAAGRKYFIGKNFALSLFVKNLTFFKENETKNTLYMGGGLSYRFGSVGQTIEGVDAKDRVYDYLRDDKK